MARREEHIRLSPAVRTLNPVKPKVILVKRLKIGSSNTCHAVR